MKRYTYLVIGTTVLTIAFLTALGTNVAPWLRGPDDWRWPYAIPGTLVRLWLPALLLALYIAAALWLYKDPTRRRNAVLAIVLSMVMTPAIQLALLYMDHPDVRSQLFYRTVSESANGFFNVGAVVMDRYDFLSHFAERMLGWYPTHPERHPPGLPVLFSLARQFFDAMPGLTSKLNQIYRPYQCHNVPLMNLPDGAIASATLQMVLPLVLSAVVWPLYKLGREMYDRPAAVRAVLLWPLLPGIALWAGFWTPLYALFTVLALLLFHYGLSRHRAVYFYLSGLVLSISLFLSFGNAAIVGFLGIYALIWLASTPSRPSWRWLVWGALLFVLGTATLWIGLWFGYRLSFFAVWRKAMGKHFEMDRLGWQWMLYHLYDFFAAAAGVPILLYWLAQTGSAAYGTWKRRRPIDTLALAFFLGLLLLDLSGAARGEVARVWAFMLPLPLLVASGRMPRRTFVFGTLLVLLSAQLFVNNIFIRYAGTDLLDPPAPPPTVAESKLPIEPLATWQSGIALRAIEIPETAVPGQPVTIHTTWTTPQQVNKPYTAFVHMYDAQGNLVTQRDAMPLDGQWPTTCWQLGKNFQDSYTLVVPDLPAAGQVYRLHLGFYWLPTGERLALDEPWSNSTQTVDLGTLEVHPASQ